MGKIDFFDVLTYDYDKRDAQLDLPDTYTEINNVSADRPAGVYEMAMAVHWDFDRTNDSAFIRFSADGGTTWYEFEGEPKDKTNSNATYFAFPYVHSGGIVSLTVEMRKEDTDGTLDVQHSAAWIKRVA